MFGAPGGRWRWLRTTLVLGFLQARRRHARRRHRWKRQDRTIGWRGSSMRIRNSERGRDCTYEYIFE